MDQKKKENNNMLLLLVSLLACVPVGYFVGPWVIENITNSLVNFARDTMYDNFFGNFYFITLVLLAWAIPLGVTLIPAFIVQYVINSNEKEENKN